VTPATPHPPTPHPVLLSDARIARIPVVERGEDLVRVVASGCLSVGEAIPVPPADGVAPPAARVHDLLRREVAWRLALAAATLPDRVRLHLVEGYRPPEVQAALYEAHRRRLLADLPGIDVAESHVLASRFVAPPSVAAHPSGAAVDVTLVDAGGHPLDMGTAIDATPEDSDGACYLDAPGISALARDNRRLLAASLRTAGFVNYPTEWWHWSYGDRYWAFVSRAAAAVYGEVSRPATKGSPVHGPTGAVRPQQVLGKGILEEEAGGTGL
jgi:D-alanyl-D-alanine dipeptidase